jgi:hypothetical protein
MAKWFFPVLSGPEVHSFVAGDEAQLGERQDAIPVEPKLEREAAECFDGGKTANPEGVFSRTRSLRMRSSIEGVSFAIPLVRDAPPDDGRRPTAS